MSISRQIALKLGRLRGDRFSRNIGWLTAAEGISRVGRILAAIILARQLDVAAFGVAAIALTVFELVRVFTENGIGAAVIRASDETVDAIANAAYRLMWIICLGLACAQLIAGLLVELAMPGRGLGLMIAALAGVYLIMPFGLVHAYILLREQRMKRVAVVGTSQTVADHLLTALLAITGFGAWAIVLPKLLTAPIWLAGIVWGRPWKRRREAGYAETSAILRFSLPVLGAELLTACRDQLDKILVSVFFGLEAVGLYYFAFNAGLGLSSALNRAFSTAFYPHLCAAQNKVAGFRSALVGSVPTLSAAYIAQAAGAALYVPIVFGADWSHAAALVAVLCLGGPARLLLDACRMLCRANGSSALEFLIAGGFCAVILTPFILFNQTGLLLAVAVSVSLASVYSLVAALMLSRAGQTGFTPTTPHPHGA